MIIFPRGGGFFPRGGAKGFFLPGERGIAQFSKKNTSLGIQQVMKISISFFKILLLEFVQCVVCFQFFKIFYIR